MGHNYTGFTVGGVVKIRDAVTQSSQALNLAWTDIQLVRRQMQPSRLYTMWFGRVSKQRVNHVYKVVNACHYALNACSLTIHRDVTDPDFAGALEPDEGWDMKDVKQIVDSEGFQVDIGNALLGANPSIEEAGHFPYCQAFIHELSHIVGYTHDVGSDHVAGRRAIHLKSNGKEYYGKIWSKNLASQHPDYARYHADAFGFYCSYQLDPAKA